MSENNTSVTSKHDVGAAAKARPGGVMLTVYRWTLLVFLAAGVVQIFLAGLGAFKLLHGAGDPACRPCTTPVVHDNFSLTASELHKREDPPAVSTVTPREASAALRTPGCATCRCTGSRRTRSGPRSPRWPGGPADTWRWCRAPIAHSPR